MNRNRLLQCLLLVIVIVLGLASRHYRTQLPALLSKNAGDVLWALCVFLFIGLLWPRMTTVRATGGALLFSYLIEISQLYHAPWIDALRQTTPGALILGSTFVWSDFLCYTIGIGIGVAGELLLMRGVDRRTPHKPH